MSQQSVTRKQRGGLVELLVQGRSATTQIIIVHAWQVVVDERVSVDVFDGGGGGVGREWGRLEQVGGRENQDRPQALAAGGQAVVGRLVQPGRAVARAGGLHGLFGLRAIGL